jgi:hypothetical protein
MKSNNVFILFLVLSIFILLCAIMTNPSIEDQKEILKNRIILLKTNSMTDIDKEVINSEIIKSINNDLEIHTNSNNFVFFSIVKGVWKGQYVNFGFAAFKNIFWAKNVNDTIKKYYLNESTTQEENIDLKTQAINIKKKNNIKKLSDDKVKNEDSNIIGAKLLFKGIKSSLSLTDKVDIYKMLDFRLSKTKGKFIFDDQGDDPDPYWGAFGASLFVTDLNSDGIEEVFVVYGNLYTSGMAGESVVLFIKNGIQYLKNLNFPGKIHGVLITSNRGYNDLLIECPGNSPPIWRWNGSEYKYFRGVKSDEEFDELKYEKLSNLIIK